MSGVFDKYIENDDPAKVRKSLLTVALLTVFFANIQFVSNELSLLGLKLVLDPARLVAFGRIVSSVLLLVFVLRSLPSLVKSILEIHQRWVDRKEYLRKLDVFAEWDMPTDYRGSPEEDLKDIEETSASERRNIVRMYSSWGFWTAICGVICIDYALPVTAGIIAISYPYSVSELITCLAIPAVTE